MCFVTYGIVQTISPEEIAGKTISFRSSMVEHFICNEEVVSSTLIESSILYMQKILINTDVGGFCLSLEAKELYLKEKGISYTVEKTNSVWCEYTILPPEVNRTLNLLLRDDPVLIKVFEQIGSERFSAYYCTVKIVEIPDDVQWIVCESNGYEWVAEKHRIWNE